MTAATRLAGFDVVLVAVLTGAYGVGAVLRSPADAGAPDTRNESGVAAHGGPNGRPLRSYEVEHEKELHLIAVRRDLAGYQHVHPNRDRAGRWSTQLDLLPGSWRVYAEFVPGDGGAPEGLTLGADLEVAGTYAPEPTSAVSMVATVGEYRVSLEGAPRAGVQTEVFFTVTRDGHVVVPQPYLGARGHLVALREGDLAYLHVHPDEDSLSFAATFPTAGRYRLFLDMKVDGEVWTVPFTVEVTA